VTTPRWLETAIFYEIYPQSFYDANGDGIGDLQGITEKLDYIKDLGCDALWLNPCFDSPFYDAGYDVRDYRKIAARYGTNEDMRRLFNAAHERGMRVLLDLVPGHTSVEHEWFKASMRSDAGPFAKRYIWSGSPWERFNGIDNISGYLNGVCDRGTVAVNFFSTQPAINYGFAEPDPEKPWQSAADSPEALAARADIKEVMRFWLSMGCDGFRVDMAHSLVKADKGYRKTIELWRGFRAFLDAEFPKAAIVSEWGKPDQSLAAGFHMDFLLHFGDSHYNDLFRDNPYFSGAASGDLTGFIAYYKKVRAAAGPEGLICIPSSNHDMARIARRLTDTELKLAFAFLLSMPGAPFIYYGDEIGMRYLEDMPSVEGGYERTGSRSPMQWDSTLNAGFSSAKPEELYIPVDPDRARPNVCEQLADEDSLLNEVKRLIKVRRGCEALWNDRAIEFVSGAGAGQVLAYRRGGDGGVICAFNPGRKAAEAPFLSGLKPLYIIGGSPAEAKGSVTMPPQSAGFFR
jgi:maltose alpha-D-glucosyltransferase/alpha-amylase